MARAGTKHHIVCTHPRRIACFFLGDPDTQLELQQNRRCFFKVEFLESKGVDQQFFVYFDTVPFGLQKTVFLISH